MNTQQVADKLVAMCRAGQFAEARAELYDDNCVSIEAAEGPGAHIQGIDAIQAKGKEWINSVEQMHDTSISDPIVIGNHFAVTHMVDCTFKERGRLKVEEVSVYQVRNGKIIKEQFFYDVG